MQVYFDNAATTPLAKEVIDEMTDMLSNEFGNPSSIHSLGRSSRAKLEKARKSIANGIEASIGEIFFTSSATESNNTAIRKSVDCLKVTRIISSPTEHPCVLKTIKSLEETHQVNVHWLSVDSEGKIDLAELEKELSDNKEKTLVSLMYGNNEIGTIHPISKVSKLCREHGAYLHCDAVQVVGKFPLSVQELSIDFLSGTAHKMYGPKGSAFLYINSDTQITPFMTGGSQERNMRAGTENVYGIIGLATAFELALKEMDNRKEKTLAVRNHMKQRLIDSIEGVTFNGVQEGTFLYHILSVGFPATPKNQMLIYNLDIKNIAASAGSACSSGTNKGSHVIEAIKPGNEHITIRFSFSHNNTKEEADYVIDCLKEVLE